MTRDEKNNGTKARIRGDAPVHCQRSMPAGRGAGES